MTDWKAVTPTPTQQKTLDAIRHLTNQAQGIPPSRRELADYLGVTPATVQQSLTLLVRDGHVVRDPKKARSIVLVK